MQARDGKAQVLEVLPAPRVLRESRQVDRFAFHAMQRMQHFERNLFKSDGSGQFCHFGGRQPVGTVQEIDLKIPAFYFRDDFSGIRRVFGRKREVRFRVEGLAAFQNVGSVSQNVQIEAGVRSKLLPRRRFILVALCPKIDGLSPNNDRACLGEGLKNSFDFMGAELLLHSVGRMSS